VSTDFHETGRVFSPDKEASASNHLKEGGTSRMAEHQKEEAEAEALHQGVAELEPIMP